MIVVMVGLLAVGAVVLLTVATLTIVGLVDIFGRRD